MKTTYLGKTLLVILVITLSHFSSLFAQDIIYTKDAREIEVEILKIDGSTVK